ncbi:MAG: VOC family protein [Bacteroidota bacterium]
MHRQFLANISLLVRDYDEAIEYYTQKLGFQLIEDTPLSPEKRWVRVAPPGSKETALLLAKAASPEQIQHIGQQTGGRVFLFLKTNQFWTDYERMKALGVTFVETPRSESFGDVVVFKDLYGNKWYLIEDKPL